jgi:hypothetical protein
MVGLPAVSAPPPVSDTPGAHGAVMVDAPSSAPTIQRAPRAPRAPSPGTEAGARRRRIRRAGALAFALVVLGLLGSAAYLALQSVYFIGTNSRGLITLYQGLPYKLPGSLTLYSSQYVSGVSASTLSPEQRHKLLDHSLRSEEDAGSLIRSLELEQLE